MTHRAARFLTRLYPETWRARFGAEFQTFLESRDVSLREVVNIAGAALLERMPGLATIVVHAGLATAAVIGTVYLSDKNAPLASTLAAHRILWLGWAVLEASALLTVAMGAAAAMPALSGMLRRASRDLLWKLTRPLGAGLLLLLWLAVAGRMAAGEKGIWVTLIGLGMFVQSVADVLKYVVTRSSLIRNMDRWRRGGLALAAWIMVSSIMAAGWGSLGRLFVHEAFFGAGGYVYWSLVASVQVAVAIDSLLAAKRIYE